MRDPLPSDLGEAFAVGAAIRAGATARRLRAPDVEAPFHGARIQVSKAPERSGDVWTMRRAAYLRLMRAYVPVLQAGAFFCGPSAAVAWGIPLPAWAWPGEQLHVGIHWPQRSPRRSGVIGHQFTRGFIDLAETEGLPVTDPASTWASLGGVLGPDDLVAAADRVLRVPRHPGGFREVTETALATRDQLEELVRRKGRPGAPQLRRALEHARTGSSSPPETQIRLILAPAGLPEPALDHDVYDGHGRFLGCSELAYPRARVAMEYESDGHLTRLQLRRDIEKYQSYAEADWYPVRLTSELVYRMPREAVRRVQQAAASSGLPPSMWR